MASARAKGLGEWDGGTDGGGVRQAGFGEVGEVGTVKDPLRHFRDRRGFFDLGGGSVAEHLVPARWEGITLGEVALSGAEE